jgi:hypothetical protein
MSGDENDMRVIFVRDPALELQPIDVRKAHVQDHAGRNVGLWIREILSGRTERNHAHVIA